jgi:Uma2 family endonuclease
MATTTASVESKTRPLMAEQRVVLRGLDWEIYETLLHHLEGQPIRLTYDRGDLELMSPSAEHEEFGNLLGRMVETLTEELRLPCIGAGSTTWRKKLKDRGLEPDECYYLESVTRLRGKRRNLDLAVDPPPDLAIEVEISRSCLDRMEIYSDLGVPEVWRFDGEELKIELLHSDSKYQTSATSRCFPFLDPGEVASWLKDGAASEDHSEWGRQFRAWVRAELAPRLDGDKLKP